MPSLRATLAGFALLVNWPAVAVSAGEPAVRTFAVRVPGDGGVAEALGGGVFQRWILPDNPSLALAVGPDADGEVVIEAVILPADRDTRTRLAGLVDGLPVDLSDDILVFDGTPYREVDYALALRLPPADETVAPAARSERNVASRPTLVVVGYDARPVASLVDRVLIMTAGVRFDGGAEEVDYVLRENRYSQRSGRWQTTGDGLAVDPEERNDMALREGYYAGLKPIERRAVVLRVPAGRREEEELQALADKLDRKTREMAARIPIELVAPLEVIFETDFVTQGRHLTRIGEAVLDDDGRVHLVYHPDDTWAFTCALGRALVRLSGLTPAPWLEDGAALWLSRTWYGRDFSEWLPDLVYGRVLPTAEELLAPERQADGSTVLWPPIAATVIEDLPGTSLRARLAASPSQQLVARILGRMSSSTPVEDRPSLTPTEADGKLPFQKGISLAMANGLEVGYHAPEVDEQLVRLRELGADSVSLMPFAGQSSPTGPSIRFFNRSPASETDVGLIHAARLAHRQHFAVLWKPHIWVSHDSWPGEIRMDSESEWRAWWRGYRRFLLHHAILAEHTGSEIFAIGVELGQTLDRADDWQHLIRAVRRIYRGRLTYSGNWWADYDRVPFWDRLDFVGVDAYFPLAHEIGAGRSGLEAGARRAIDELAAAAHRFGKPMLLTEIGYPARQGAWTEPHKEGGTLSEADQELAYEVFFEALGRPRWLAGVYVWKVFSHPRIVGRGPDFQFLGRPAEAAVRDYFQPPKTAADRRPPGRP